MSTTNNALVIIGSGPGISNGVAHHFAQHRFSNISLIARSTSAVEKTKASLLSTHATRNLSIKTHTLDITDLPALRSTLAEISSIAPIECVFFNAARVRGLPFFEDTVEEISYDFAITNLALYEVAKWAMPQLVSMAEEGRDRDARPSLIVTNSLLPSQPVPALFSLSLTKAAQRNLAMSLEMEFKDKGINVAVISVGGQVAEGNAVLNPKTIAERIWGVYRRERGDYQFDTEILEES